MRKCRASKGQRVTGQCASLIVNLAVMVPTTTTNNLLKSSGSFLFSCHHHHLLLRRRPSLLPTTARIFKNHSHTTIITPIAPPPLPISLHRDFYYCKGGTKIATSGLAKGMMCYCTASNASETIVASDAGNTKNEEMSSRLDICQMSSQQRPKSNRAVCEFDCEFGSHGANYYYQ
ncbi:aminoacyl tRNA synthase complex-interacting multifunctional protein 1 [Abeliophyllum distichum]|uniref:Aminoacyl tRNA synthase complex-interacting multifunctional protein 1 n=1 Tax=Abeliophyllum distichum TaxID=126358 RepID=A0ABD1RQC9_9LAMI